MRFPLADYIAAHAACRHNLGESGMRAALPRRPLSRRRVAPTILEDLQGALGRHLGVDPERVVLTHGATEANAWTLVYLSRSRTGAARSCRVELPEYPPLTEMAHHLGFQLVSRAGPVDLALVSRPRNPEGNLWPGRHLRDWAAGAQSLVVDETFREFARASSVAGEGRRRVWATGTFTKFYGADDLRVGFAVAPPEEADRFRIFAGLATDEVAPVCASAALELLENSRTLRRTVHEVMETNREHLRSVDPEAPQPVGPVFFDRTVAEGEALARRCLRESILVCPGRFFGDPSGVRVGLTRRSFPRDYNAYLRVRGRRISRRSNA